MPFVVANINFFANCKLYSTNFGLLPLVIVSLSIEWLFPGLPIEGVYCTVIPLHMIL